MNLQNKPFGYVRLLSCLLILGLGGATAPAMARVSLDGLQQEIADLRANICGTDMSQADCDSAVQTSLVERLEEQESQNQAAQDVVCQLVQASPGDIDASALGCADPNGALRLSDGTDNRGRLEVFDEGEWGTVCDDRFDTVDADVACRQLGYSSGTPIYFLRSTEIPQGTGVIMLDDLACVGTENRLVDCPHRGIRLHNCSHFEDVGVECSP